MSNHVNESRVCDESEVEISEEDLEYYKSLCDKNVNNDSNIDLYSEEIKNISQEDIDNSDNPAETEFYLELIKYIVEITFLSVSNIDIPVVSIINTFSSCFVKTKS